MPSFREWRQDLNDPRRGADGIAWANSVGVVQDEELALLRVAALARLPKYCPDDGLDLLGKWFELPRYPGTTDDAYRAQIVAVFPTYVEDGSPQAIVDQLHAFGIADVRVVLEEQNHGATAAYNGAGTYNRGQLVNAVGIDGAQNIYEQVGPNNAAAAASPPTGKGQTQADGACVWAWRCGPSPTQDANDPGYDGWWYSRFDVVLGGMTPGNFGTLAVNEFAIGGALCALASTPTVPAVGASVNVSLSASGALTPLSVVYVEQMGYYQVATAAGTHALLKNLGDAAAAYALAWSLASNPAGAIFAPDVWGAPGQFPNAAPGTSIGTGQQIVIGGAGIIGQTRIGIAIVDDAARQAVKSIILRWKASHGYAGRLVLAYNGAVLDPAGEPGYNNGVAFIGRMIGLNTQIPFTIGGYDRS